jgi:hypothetical protein
MVDGELLSFAGCNGLLMAMMMVQLLSRETCWLIYAFDVVLLEHGTHRVYSNTDLDVRLEDG